MTGADEKQALHRYLRNVRGVLAWKLEGLSDYDIRRPMTPTGTNLLGIIKHVALVESGYLGGVFGRPFEGPQLNIDASERNSTSTPSDACRGGPRTGKRCACTASSCT